MDLDISRNGIGNEGATALGSLLGSMNTLKELGMGGMLYSYENGNIVPQWQPLFTTLLSGSNLDLVFLDLGSNNIDDEVIRHLTRLVTSMSSLKHLRLNHNTRVTPSGWQVLTEFFQSTNFTLRKLDLDGNNINDDTLITFTNALSNNKTLKLLSIESCTEVDSDSDSDAGDETISEGGWEAISTFLCNKTSILETYNSNHTLQDLSDDDQHDQMNLPYDLLSYLELNNNKDKAEVARQKILQTHFSDVGDTSKMQDFLDIELEVMPNAIAWIGKTPHAIWKGKNVSGLSLLYNLMMRLPDLFDSNDQKKPGMAKRKRDI